MMGEFAGDFSALSDEALVICSRAGDSGADEELYARYKNTVRCKARPYFLMGADREDLLQEGMIGLYKAVRDFDPGRQVSFRAFAEVCITRQLITAVKTATRQKHIPLNSYVSLYRPAFSAPDADTERNLIDMVALGEGENPEDAFISRESLSRMERDILAMLSPLEARILDAFLDGKSYAEIAAELSCTTKTVDNALQRIKRKMEKHLDLSGQ